mmetsp:Transcript_16479/g.46178  ORF Transcript_16479/g.46178 Transcript_16479/m.46178 type:complete len:113 (-) Transcript_16479:472-810(-)
MLRRRDVSKPKQFCHGRVANTRSRNAHVHGARVSGRRRRQQVEGLDLNERRIRIDDDICIVRPPSPCVEGPEERSADPEGQVLPRAIAVVLARRNSRVRGELRKTNELFSVH